MTKHNPIIDRLNREQFTLDQLDEIAAAVEQKRRALGVGTDQRDDTIKAQAAEIAKLKRDVERRDIHFRATQSGAATLDAEIERLQTERDELAAKLAATSHSLSVNYTDAQNMTIHSAETGQQYLDASASVAESSIVSRAMIRNYDTVRTLVLERIYEQIAPVAEPLAGRDIMVEPSIAIQQIRFWSMQTAANLFLIALHSEALAQSKDPALICYEIMLQLQAYGTVSAGTVQRLDLAWIRTTLGRSVTHATLKTALEIGQRAANGETHDRISKDGFSLENIRWYTKYYAQIRTAANLPEPVERMVKPGS